MVSVYFLKVYYCMKTWTKVVYTYEMSTYEYKTPLGSYTSGEGGKVTA